MTNPESLLLYTSVAAAGASAALLTAKVIDLIEVKQNGTNGPVLFMKKDNIRHQVFLLAMSCGLGGLAISGYNNPLPVSPQTLNFVWFGNAFSVLALIDVLFTFRRRRKLSVLVAKYEQNLEAVMVQSKMAAPKPGGCRAYDPPAEPKG